MTRRDLLVGGLLAPAQEQPVFRAGTSLALVRFHAVRKNRWVDDLTRSGIDRVSHVSLARYTFSRELRRYTPPTRDLQRLKEAFGRIEDRQAAIETVKFDDSRSHDPNGATFLCEAIMETARRASRSGANATRILVAVSDGFPTTLTKPQAAAHAARECGIAVYPVALGHSRLAERAGLEQLATFDSRGTANPRDLNSLVTRQILLAMAGHIQAEYVAGYYPAPASKPRKIEVKLRSPALGRIRGGVRTLAASASAYNNQ